MYKHRHRYVFEMKDDEGHVKQYIEMPSEAARKVHEFIHELNHIMYTVLGTDEYDKFFVGSSCVKFSSAIEVIDFITKLDHMYNDPRVHDAYQMLVEKFKEE